MPRSTNSAGLPHPFGIDLLPIKAIMQRGKGGVYKALDLSVLPARFVIVKEGRRHGESNWLGVDGFAQIKHEGGVLRQLERAGVAVPTVLREFTQGKSRYLVLEMVRGRPLLVASFTPNSPRDLPPPPLSSSCIIQMLSHPPAATCVCIVKANGFFFKTFPVSILLFRGRLPIKPSPTFSLGPHLILSPFFLEGVF